MPRWFGGGGDGILRVVSLDIARGIGIFLLVLWHNSLLKDHAPLLFDAISTFNVPLFFLMSGAFLPELVTAAFVKLRLRIFLRPFLVGVLLALPLQLVDLSHPANDWFPLGVFWATGNSVMNAPLWFLSSLIVAISFVFVAGRMGLSGTRGSYIGFVLFLVGMWLISRPEFHDSLPKDKLGRVWGLPWSLDMALVPVGLMMSGRAIGQYLKRPLLGPVQELSLLAGFGAVFIWAFNAGTPALDLNNRVAANIWPLLVCTVAGMGAMLSLSRCLTYIEGNWVGVVQRFGAGSLVVLICHWPLQQVFIRVLKRFDHNLLTDLLASVVTCVLIYFFSERIVAPRPLLRKFFTGRA